MSFTMQVSTAGGTILATRAHVADSFWKRLRGLMFTPTLQEGTGLIIEPCTSIHMMFMHYPIDAIFLDKDNRIVACYDSLRPWRGISGWHRKAAKVIELPAGTRLKTKVNVGDILNISKNA